MIKKLSESEEKHEIGKLLKKETLFQGLDHALLNEFIHYLKIVTLKAHRPISETKKKLIDDNLVIVAEGLIVATRGKEQELTPPETKAYGRGDVINIMSLLDLKFPVQISSVEEDSKLLIIDLDKLEQNPKFTQIKAIIVGNITKYASERLHYIERVLSNVNEVTMRTIQQRMEDSKVKLAFGTFVVRIIIILCLYTLSLRGLRLVEHMIGNTSIISVSIIIVTALAIYDTMLKTGLSMVEFGLTTRNWKRATIESLLVTIPLLLYIGFLKYLFISFDTNYSKLPLVEINTGFDRYFNVISWPQIIIMIFYVIFAPLQEFIIRGGLQGSLFWFLSGSEQSRNWTAIILSNLIFITFHAHVSLAFALATFVPGLVWGWLYSRHKTLIGVSISHIILGLLVIFFMGVNEIAGS